MKPSTLPSSSAALLTEHRAQATRHRRVMIDGLEIFYREAGPADAPTLLLLPGFPAASHQYKTLIDRLCDQFHLLSPDYPGFGYSSAPASSNAGGSFIYTFDHLADITEHWLDSLGAHRFFMYVFDFGAPVGYRIASRHPDWIQGVIAQNGNAYVEGLGPAMQPAVRYWADRGGMEAAIRGALTPEATRAQHLDGAADPERIDPDQWTLDQHWLDQPGRARIMLDLLYDYQSNVALYPQWQHWLRERQPPLLLPWGRNDAFFPETGARAYLADVPAAEMHLLDGGHFVLDEYVDAVAGLIRDFITRHASTGNGE